MPRNFHLLRHLIFLLPFLFGTSTILGQSNLILTAVFDASLSGGVPKGVEIYVISDIPDLSIYGIGSANNGGGTDGEEFTFPSVSVLAGEFIYVASETTNFNSFFGFLPNDTTSAVDINGNDAIELFMNGVVVDVFGDINIDGSGQPWDYEDGWAYRNNNTGPDGSTFVLGNWTLSGKNALDGETTNTSATIPVPIGTFQYATTCVLPTTAANSLGFTFVLSTSATLSWTNGDGEGRIVLVKEGSAVDAVPTDGTTYLPNSNFLIGEEIGTGNRVVYNGTDDSVDLTGLTPGQTYFVEVFEYGCAPGQELYLTTVPAADAFLAEPANPTLNIDCETSTSIDLSWTNPATGIWDGFVIIGREDASPTTINSEQPSSLPVANSNFSSAPLISASPNKLVYQGTGNSVTISGITAGQNYSFKIFSYRECAACVDEWEYSSGTQLSGNASLSDVNSLGSTPGINNVTLAWNFNPSCVDEIIVVASDNSVVGIPTGSGYSINSNSFTDPLNPDLSLGEKIVYASLGNSVDVTDLTTSTEYCFKVFTRKGSEWSDGAQVCETPTTSTTLEIGDFAILSINTNTNSGKDQISFVCFKTILPGTIIDFTDNAYQKCGTPNGWGISEGWIRLTRISTPLGAGEVVTIENDNGIVTVLAPDNDWTTSEPQPPMQGSFNLNNNGEQLFILTGGNVIGPNLSNADSDAGQYLGGRILFGFNTKGDDWNPVCGNSSAGGSANSDKPDNLDCFLNYTATNDDRNKYTGPFTTATVREWFIRINDTANWTNYADNNLYSSGEDYIDFNGMGQGRTLPIDGTSTTSGLWVGDDDSDWFNCRNWATLTVPDQATNVIIPDQPTDPIISSVGAQCADLTLETSSVLTLDNSNSTIDIFGNIVVDGSLNTVSGSISFKGLGDQLISSTSGMGISMIIVSQLIIEKPLDTRVISTGSISVSEEVELIAGILDFKTENGNLELPISAIISEGSQNAYVSGPIKKIGFTSGTEFKYPTGDFRVIPPDSTVDVFQPAGIITAASGLTSNFTVEYFHENRTPGYTSPNNPPPGTAIASTCNYWMIDRGLVSPLTAQVKLYYNEAGCLDIQEAEKLVVAKQNMADNWDNIGLSSALPISGPSLNGYIISADVTSFSPFTIASSGPSLNVLPITLLSFQAKAVDNIVRTEWSTASEINNDFFAIERSKDGGSWEKVGTVDGAGDSHSEISYSFVDNRPFAGISYYRLRQTDHDGSSTLSETRAVEIRQNGDFGIDKIYRAQSGLNIAYRATAPYVTVEIYDLLGKHLHGELLENAGNGFGIIYPDLTRGAYLLRLSTNSETNTEKFVW